MRLCRVPGADLQKRTSLTSGTALGGRCNLHASRTQYTRLPGRKRHAQDRRNLRWRGHGRQPVDVLRCPMRSAPTVRATRRIPAIQRLPGSVCVHQQRVDPPRLYMSICALIARACWTSRSIFISPADARSISDPVGWVNTRMTEMLGRSRMVSLGLKRRRQQDGRYGGRLPAVRPARLVVGRVRR